jgi:hypothetical protein
VGFGKFIGNAVLAPIGMLAPQGNHLLLDGRIEPSGAQRRAMSKRIERSIATSLKAWLPIIEGRATHMSGAAGKLDIAGGFVGLKQQSALLGRRHRKMNAFVSHHLLRSV